MKIVQSLWSKPSLEKDLINNDSRSLGGWLKRKYYYMSWALSCLRLREYYSSVELVTDHYGKTLLIDRLKLPYSNVVVVLNQLDHYSPYLWTIGKIYTYSIQKEPFIHVDNDVFIWAKFESELETAFIIAQNIEDNNLYYQGVLDTMVKDFVMPEAIRNHISSNLDNILVSNTGIVGGNRVDFFKRYAELAFEIINSNLTSLYKVNIGAFSIAVEQYLFYFLAQDENMSITYLINESINYESDARLLKFHEVPYKTKYIHPVSSFKKNTYICENVEARLKIEYPEYYYRIYNLINTYQI